ncbi:hypothetical protein Tco_0391445, partial [Tanacetum coccineum]
VDPTPSQSVPATSSSHVQITQPPPTVTHSPVQPTSMTPPTQPVQPTSVTPPTQPVQTTSPPPVSTIPDIQPTLPPSPQTDQGDTFATPEKSKGSGEAQEEQI